MPRYVYECESCEKVFEVAHSIKERLEICNCDGPLRRLPSMPILIKDSSGDSAAQKVHKELHLVRVSMCTVDKRFKMLSLL